MNWRLPQEVTGRVLAEIRHPGRRQAVPAEFSAELFFEGGVSAGFYCSFLAENQQWATISGTRGYLRSTDFVLPFVGKDIGLEIFNSSYHIRGCDFRMEPGRQELQIPEPSHGHAQAQESNMFRHFAAQVQSGTLNEAWPETALKTQQVMNACFESAGHGGRATKLAV